MPSTNNLHPDFAASDDILGDKSKQLSAQEQMIVKE